MKKKFQSRGVRYGKDQSGCIWSLVNIFDFRRGRSGRKLLSDNKFGSRRVSGADNSGNGLLISPARDSNSCFLEKEEYMPADGGEVKVKKLIEEEMCSEQDKKKMNNTEIRLKLSDSEQEGPLGMYHKRKNRMHNRSRALNHVLSKDETLESKDCYYQNKKQQFGNHISVDKLVEEFCCHLRRNNGFVKHEKSGKAHVQSNESLSNFKKKLAEAIKDLVSQRLDGGEDPMQYHKLFHSKKLMDALKVSSFDEELLDQFMQNPHIVLEKYVQNLKNSKVEESKFLGRRNVKQSGHPENSESSNRIIILKPKLVGYRNSKDDTCLPPSQEFSKTTSTKVLGERTGSHLTLAEIKRKFKHALGKERNKISNTGTSNSISYEAQNFRNGEKGFTEENAGRNSPSKDHFYFEIIPRQTVGGRRGDESGKLKHLKINAERESNFCPKKEVFDPYSEAREHLSKMLTEGDDNVEFLNRCIPNTRARSHQEYNFSPTGSPGKEWEHSFITAQMRFSACGNLRNTDDEATPSRQDDNGCSIVSVKTQTCVSPNVDEQTVQVHPSTFDELVHENNIRIEGGFCANKDEMNSKRHEEIGNAIESSDRRERNVLDASSSLSSSSIPTDGQNDDTSDNYDDKRPTECLEQVQFESNQMPSSPMASPSSSSIGWKVAEDLENVANIRERPSPKSVLDLLPSDDDISPGKAMLQHVELPMQPLRIEFEDNERSDTCQNNITDLCMEEKELTFDFVKTVLLSTGMNWVELCLEQLSSKQLLDPSLLDHDELEPSANQSFSDHKVLFDCINEVLKDTCRRNSPWSLSLEPCVRPILDLKDAIREVGEGVYWHLLPPPLPCTMEQIVEKDMARTGTWMDLHWTTEVISTEFSEAIFEDLMEDSILKCIHEGLTN